ncbi:MAG: GNAT family N-acetyltransferase [Gammaproteobacteria bacterium]|nr:GNAT family N-acetyltransferase [Gammaproteobacteria bacterium]
MAQQLVKQTLHPQAAVPHRSSSAARELGRRIAGGLLGAAFVLLWSSGYPAARIALDHSGPFTLLELRFAGAGLIFAGIAAIGGVPWPRGRAALRSAVVGSLQLAVAFAALYWAASQGMNVGLIALVIGTMPIVTALLGRVLFAEAVRALQWVGFALGFAGVALAVGESATEAHGGGPAAYLAVLAGLLAISVGTLYQKHHASNVDARSGLALQHLTAALLLLPFAAHEGLRADGSPLFFASLGWVIGVNSLAGFALFFVLLRRGMVNQVATLFFLMPPVTAVIDYLVLGDALRAYTLAGLAVSAFGVYLATRPRPGRAPPPLVPGPAGLPQETGATRTRLKDGREVVIRPIRAADLPALKSFFAVLSPATRRLRFHATLREVPEGLLREFTQPDRREDVALIAEAQAPVAGEAPLLVGEARFVRSPAGDTAEFALVVADDWRRVGLGSSMMRTLVNHAGLSGIRRLCGDALIDNEATRRFLRSLGARRSGKMRRDDTVRLCLGTGERHG